MQSNRSRSKGGFGDNPQNGNKKGRPKQEDSWAGVLRAAAGVRTRADGKDRTKKEAIAEILVSRALDGDLAAIKMLQDRMEGLCTATVNHESKGRPIASIERVIVDGTASKAIEQGESIA